MTPRAGRQPDAATEAPPFAVAFRVPGRPAPWSVPVVFRNGGCRKDARLVSWQRTVALYARLAMAGREPYAGPVELRVTFTVAKPSGRAKREIDLTNALKGFEDPLQGIVIVNDRQVCRQVAERVRGEPEGAAVEVRALDTGG
jgi:Holliday junction resolvase RusA-like endonuclease